MGFVDCRACAERATPRCARGHETTRKPLPRPDRACAGRKSRSVGHEQRTKRCFQRGAWGSWFFVSREAAFVSRTREGPQDGAARSAAGEGREADFGPAAGRAAPCGEAALPPSGRSCLRAERAASKIAFLQRLNPASLLDFLR